MKGRNQRSSQAGTRRFTPRSSMRPASPKNAIGQTRRQLENPISTIASGSSGSSMVQKTRGWSGDSRPKAMMPT